MSYWDTSALVKLYAQEPDSAFFENYLSSVPSSLATSRITPYEARATFSRKESEGILHRGAARTLHNELLQDVAAGDVRLIELGTDVEQEYGRILDFCYQQTQPTLASHPRRHSSGLRAGGRRNGSGGHRPAPPRGSKTARLYPVPGMSAAKNLMS